MRPNRRKVYNVGVNDASYPLYEYQIIEGKKVNTWRCPHYVAWVSMLTRCYSEKFLKSRPSYIGCSVCPEWLYFSAFRNWRVTQDFEGQQLDKDLLATGNKIYSPSTCLYISPRLNRFIEECTASRGDWPIGVTYDKKKGKFAAQSSSALGKKVNIGRYFSPEAAHIAWAKFKLQEAWVLYFSERNIVAAEALIRKYEGYLNSARGES